MKNGFEIIGQAYTDTITKATGKSLRECSQMLGFSPTYLKNVRADNRIKASSAQLIEKVFGVSVSPYIVKEPAVEETEGAIVYADDIVEAVYGAMLAYLDGNGDLKDFLRSSIINYLESVAAQNNTVNGEVTA